MNPLASASIAAVLAISATAQDPVPAPLGDQLPDLLDQSSWAQDTTFEGDLTDKSRRGVYPVGNGRVFTYAGLGTRANTLQGLTGPRYQTSGEDANTGNFGEVTIDLIDEGQWRGSDRYVVGLPRQRVRRVRGANFAVTEDAEPDGLTLRTLVFAPPDRQVIVQVIEVTNHRKRAVPRLGLRVSTDGAAAPAAGGRAIREDYAASGRACTAFYTLDGSRVDGPDLVLSIGELRPGERWSAVLTIHTVPETPPLRARPPDPVSPDEALQLAETNLEWWRKKLAGTSRLETDHSKLRDLFEDWKVLMLVQRCAQSGVVSSMINTRGARVRDANGAILALLRYRLWQEARDVLEFYRAAATATGRVAGDYPLDLDLVEDPDVDWNAMTVEGNGVASWMILQHFWYWRATRDSELIRRHWPLLEVCMKKQPRGERGQMKFDPGGTVLQEAVFPQTNEMYSFANGVLFLMAVQAMAEMTSTIDREVNPHRYAIEPQPKPRGDALMQRSAALMRDLEDLYWMRGKGYFAAALEPVDLSPLETPFANSNLLPLWVGWTFPTGTKSSSNLEQTLSKLWRDGVRIGSTPTVGYARGDLQGMLLAALTERDGQRRLEVVDSLLAMAEPAGEWGDLYDPDGRPTAVDDPEWPNRLRPGESGVNLDAIMFALTGVRFASYANWDIDDIRLDLRLPNGATFLAARNVEKDGRKLDIHLREVFQPLTEESFRANAQRLPEADRDPERRHRHLHFVIDLLSPNPPQGYHDLTVRATGTLFVRHLRREEPVEETEIWVEDSTSFLPPATPPRDR